MKPPSNYRCHNFVNNKLKQLIVVYNPEKNDFFRLNLAVYYDDAFYNKFGSRSFTRIAAIIALVAEQYSEVSFKTRLELTMRTVEYSKGHNWEILTWNQNHNYWKTNYPPSIQNLGPKH